MCFNYAMQQNKHAKAKTVEIGIKMVNLSFLFFMLFLKEAPKSQDHHNKDSDFKGNKSKLTRFLFVYVLLGHYPKLPLQSFHIFICELVFKLLWIIVLKVEFFEVSPIVVSQNIWVIVWLGMLECTVIHMNQIGYGENEKI